MTRRYALALLLTAIAGALGYAMEDLLHLRPLPLFYLAVLAATILGGTGPGLFSLATSALVIDVLFIPPLGQLAHDRRALLDVAFFSTAGLCIVLLTRAMRRSDLARARALKDLEEQRALLQVTLAQLPVGVVMARGPSGEIVLVNEQVRRILGLGPGQDPEADLNRLDFRGPDDARLGPGQWPIYRALRQGESIVDEEIIFARDDGTRAHLLVSAAPVRTPDGRLAGAVASFHDVTGRRNAEETVRRSEKLLRAVLDALPVGVWITDERGTITTANPAGQAVWGGARYVGPEEYGQYKGWWADTGRPIGAEEWALARAVRTGERVLGEVVEIETFDGARKVMLNSAVPVLDERGWIQGAIVVNQDISRLIETEREVRRLNADLEQRVEDRTRALREAVGELEEFAYSVAHDLRAPLRAMSGLATLLQEDYADRPLDAEGRDYARRIAEAARRMDALIQDLLAYSRTTRAEISSDRVRVEELLGEVTEEMSSEIRERNAEVAVEPSALAVEAYRPLLLQVVRNLLSNAMKFVPPDTRPRILLRAEDRNGRVRLWVEDNGIGIAPEHRHRIFGVFQRLHTQEAYPGTGIGLSIVRRATERMGGKVGVESTPGRGSRFWVELPPAGDRKAGANSAA